MPESGFFGAIYRITDIIYKLAWSNVLWFFTAGFPFVFLLHPELLEGAWIVPFVLSLVILPPGTAALFHVMRRWQEDEDISVWREYWRGWKENWKQAYAVIDLYILIGFVLVVDVFVVTNVKDSGLQWLSFVFLPLGLLYTLTGISLCSVLVHFQLKVRHIFRNAFVMAVSHLFSSLAILIVLGIVLWTALWKMPALFFFFFGSVTAWAFTWQTRRIIHKFQQMEADRAEEAKEAAEAGEAEESANQREKVAVSDQRRDDTAGDQRGQDRASNEQVEAVERQGKAAEQ